jgi:hypothetical protein
LFTYKYADCSNLSNLTGVWSWVHKCLPKKVPSTTYWGTCWVQYLHRKG